MVVLTKSKERNDTLQDFLECKSTAAMNLKMSSPTTQLISLLKDRFNASVEGVAVAKESQPNYLLNLLKNPALLSEDVVEVKTDVGDRSSGRIDAFSQSTSSDSSSVYQSSKSVRTSSQSSNRKRQSKNNENSNLRSSFIDKAKSVSIKSITQNDKADLFSQSKNFASPVWMRSPDPENVPFPYANEFFRSEEQLVMSATSTAVKAAAC